MDELLTFRQWLKKKFCLSEQGKEVARFMLFFMGSLILGVAVVIGIPLYFFGQVGFLFAIPGFFLLIIYWMYRLERFFFMEDD